MRNWKSGRICNYLMKGLLLCALVVGGWFTAGIGAKAESLTHSVEFKSEESQIVQFKRADEYSCAMKSHFRKFGNQMSGSGNHLCNYASLLA